MKRRCYFLAVICGGSLYNIVNYSSYDPAINNFFSIPYLHCLFTAYYLLWDTYKMTLSTNRNELFRTELIIHHFIAMFQLINLMNYIPLQISCILIMECISLMNHVWKDKPFLLKMYRTLCIFCVRMPSSLYWGLFYNSDTTHAHYLIILSPTHYTFLKYVMSSTTFYILYDLLVLYWLYKPRKN